MAQRDCGVVVVSDYLTNPYVVNMSLARSRSMAERHPGSHPVGAGARQNFVESLLKQSLPRRSSFSFGSKLIRRNGSFSFKLFKSKSSSVSVSDSLSTSSSTVSCQSNKSTEEFWNQYRRNQPKLSFTMRFKPVHTIKQVNNIHEKSPPPTHPHNSISL